MKYDPNKDHRRSIRLKGYDYTQPGAYFITICTHHRQCLLGEITEGEMQLGQFGKIVRSHWLKLPKYHPRLQLDAFIVMPNHIHGILVLTHDSVGVGFDDNLSNLTDDPVGAGFGNNLSNLTDDPVRAGFGNNLSNLTNQSSAKPAPTTPAPTTPAPTTPAPTTPAPTKNHGIPEIVRGFKTFSSRQINQIRQTSGAPVWQRNYYECIIRNEIALQTIQDYIQTNPVNWNNDRLYPV